MAHQSALLMVDVVGDNRMIMLLGEIENLKAKLEEETNKHNQHSEELQVIQTILFAAKKCKRNCTFWLILKPRNK